MHMPCWQAVKTMQMPGLDRRPITEVAPAFFEAPSVGGYTPIECSHNFPRECRTCTAQSRSHQFFLVPTTTILLRRKAGHQAPKKCRPRSLPRLGSKIHRRTQRQSIHGSDCKTFHGVVHIHSRFTINRAVRSRQSPCQTAEDLTAGACAAGQLDRSCPVMSPRAIVREKTKVRLSK